MKSALVLLVASFIALSFATPTNGNNNNQMMSNGSPMPMPMSMPMTRGNRGANWMMARQNGTRMNNDNGQYQTMYDPNQMNRPYSNQMMMNTYPMLMNNRATRGAGWNRNNGMSNNGGDSMENGSMNPNNGQMTDMMMRDQMSPNGMPYNTMGNNGYGQYPYGSNQMMYTNGM